MTLPGRNFAAHGLWRSPLWQQKAKARSKASTALIRDEDRGHSVSRRVFAKDRMYIGAVGDITPEELGALLDKLLADLPETGKPIPGTCRCVHLLVA